MPPYTTLILFPIPSSFSVFDLSSKAYKLEAENQTVCLYYAGGACILSQLSIWVHNWWAKSGNGARQGRKLGSLSSSGWNAIKCELDLQKDRGRTVCGLRDTLCAMHSG